MSTPTRKVLTIVLGALFVGLIWFFFGNGESKANPVEDIIATGQQHIAAVQADVDRSVAELQADVEEFTAQANEFVAVATQPEKLAVTSGKVASLVSAAPTPTPAIVSAPAAPTSPVAPIDVPGVGPVSIPNEAQRLIDPVYEAGLNLVDENYFMAPAKEYDPMDPIDEQLRDTVDMFTVRTVTADAGACNQVNPDFDAKVACGASIVDSNNGDEKVAPVNVLGRYALFVITGLKPLCGGYLFPVNYCDGFVNMSEPAMDYMATKSGAEAKLEDVTFVLAHEYGHMADDYAMRARGENMYEITVTLPLEQSADGHAGKTIMTAERNGYLKPGTLESNIVMIRAASSNSDPSHGGPDMREGAVRRGAATAA